MCKKVVVIGGGKYQLSGIQALKSRGYYVIVFDGCEYRESSSVADEFVLIDIKDYSAIIAYIEEKHRTISYVLSFATELALKSVVEVKEYFGITSGISSNEVDFSSDKYLQREILKEANLPYPKYFKVKNIEDIHTLVVDKKVSFPFIIKPINGAGSRGVSLVRDETMLERAYHEAVESTTLEDVLVEEFINGVEFTVDGFISHGEINLFAISEKSKPLNNYTVSTELFYNSPFVEKIKSQVTLEIEGYLKSAKIDNTIVHLEFIYRLEDKKIYIIETSVRSGGFGVFDEILPAVTGVDIVNLFIDLSIGKELEPFENENNVVILRFLTANNGLFSRVIYVDEMLAYKGTKVTVFEHNIGKYYSVDNDASRSLLGYIVSYGKEWKDVFNHTNIVENNIRFIMK